jgi:hypothetical protein
MIGAFYGEVNDFIAFLQVPEMKFTFPDLIIMQRDIFRKQLNDGYHNAR